MTVGWYAVPRDLVAAAGYPKAGIKSQSPADRSGPTVVRVKDRLIAFPAGQTDTAQRKTELIQR